MGIEQQEQEEEGQDFLILPQMNNNINFMNKCGWEELSTTNHSLFIKHDEETNECEANFFIGRFEEDDKTNLNRVFNALWTLNPCKEFKIIIDSEGGNYNELVSLHNIVKNKFKTKCSTILNSCGHSAGAFIFCCGHKRIVFENSQLMFHAWSGGFAGKANEVKVQHEFFQKHFNKFSEKLLVDNHFLTKSEFRLMMDGKDFWFDAVGLCERNVATHIVFEGKIVKSKDYLAYVNKNITKSVMFGKSQDFIISNQIGNKSK